MDDLSNALASKRFFPEPPLDIVQDLLVSGLVLVQDILELQVSRSKTVAEMLSENPAAVCNILLSKRRDENRNLESYMRRRLLELRGFRVISARRTGCLVSRKAEMLPA
jgi:hypothetical protein